MRGGASRSASGRAGFGVVGPPGGKREDGGGVIRAPGSGVPRAAGAVRTAAGGGVYHDSAEARSRGQPDGSHGIHTLVAR
jgi:hypothetical protein